MTQVSALIYAIIVLLGGMALWQYLALGRRALPLDARPSIVALVATLTAENIYYGAGRLLPDIYLGLADWWPGVLVFKGCYIIALASLNARLNQR